MHLKKETCQQIVFKYFNVQNNTIYTFCLALDMKLKTNSELIRVFNSNKNFFKEANCNHDLKKIYKLNPTIKSIIYGGDHCLTSQRTTQHLAKK